MASDFRTWLEKIGLERFATLFEEQLIDFEVLDELDEHDLEKLGLPLGARKKLLKAREILHSRASVASGLTEEVGGVMDHLQRPSDNPVSNRIPPAQAERRQLTVMFIDLVGSTALASRLDPEDMRAVLTAYQNTVAGVITRFEGFIAKFMGDGVLVYFGWPTAHEDEPERAARAGLAAAHAVSDLRTNGGERLKCRVGIATGLVVVGDLVGEGTAQEQAVIGETPNLAARLQGIASPGEVVIGEITRRLLNTNFAFDDLGLINVKGIAEPIRAYRLLRERLVESRFEARTASLSPMYGREQELALLEERWCLAQRGEGQAVLLTGEAGMGKSRIMRALLDLVAKDTHTRIRYQCSPYHTNSAFWPVIQQLNFASGISPSDENDIKLDKLEKLTTQSPNSQAANRFLAALLGLDGNSRYGRLELTPQAQRERTLEVLIQQLLVLAKKQPVLMTLEDAHWIDPTTLELIQLGLDEIVSERVLILLTSRPDNQLRLAAHPHVTKLMLNRLSRNGALSIIRQLGGSELSSETVDMILARTDGVPLFVEELTKAILELGEAAIPATLHDSLMARLDRIPEIKAIAQTAACIGREFDYELILQLSHQTETELLAALDRLIDAELLFQRGIVPHASYSFKHALVRDAAYHSLLRTHRQKQHAKIAELLTQRAKQTRVVQPELLANHYEAAGNIEEAVRHWEKAGANATEQSAFKEAIHHYERALNCLSGLSGPVQQNVIERSVQMGLGDALSWTKGFAAPEVESAFARARELSAQIDETVESFRIEWGLWHFYIIRGDFERAQSLAIDLKELGGRLGDPGLDPHVIRTVAETHLWRGEFGGAIDEVSKLLGISEHCEIRPLPGIQNPIVMCYAWQALASWFLGYPDQACTHAEAGIEAASHSNHAGDMGVAVIMSSWVRLLRKEYALTIEKAEQARQFNADRGFAFHVAVCEMLLGAAQIAGTQDRNGLHRLKTGIGNVAATGAGIFQAGFTTLLGAGYGLISDREKGLDILADAEIMIDQSGERWQEAELHRHKGELLQAIGRPLKEVEDSFQRSLEIARRQNAKSLELRTSSSLAKLWHTDGNKNKARDLLQPVCDWFADGLDTPDLTEARQLLDALS